jgi:hypothetical protein
MVQPSTAQRPSDAVFDCICERQACPAARKTLLERPAKRQFLIVQGNSRRAHASHAFEGHDVGTVDGRMAPLAPQINRPHLSALAREATADADVRERASEPLRKCEASLAVLGGTTPASPYYAGGQVAKAVTAHWRQDAFFVVRLHWRRRWVRRALPCAS